MLSNLAQTNTAYRATRDAKRNRKASAQSIERMSDHELTMETETDSDSDSNSNGQFEDTGTKAETETSQTGEMTDPPTGWRIWNNEPGGKRILVFRPDIFSERNDLPAMCLPTIHVTNGSQASRPGASQRQTDTWHVILTLEPEIEAITDSYETRQTALTGAHDIAERFAQGRINYRDPYQVPRPDYFQMLDTVIEGTETISKESD